MYVLFYIGLAVVFLTFIPWLMISGRMTRDMRLYEKMPRKLDEIRMTYRKRRFQITLVQLAGIILAMVGVLA